MLRLRPYKACDAQAVTQWLKDERAFRLWSADRYPRYPITAADLNAYYDKEKQNETIWAMTAFDETGVVGHFTMRYPQAGNYEEIRLGFVIVDDQKRGKGYGKEMLSLARAYAFDLLKVRKITLGVFAQNTNALCCYRASGFRPVVRSEPEQYNCMGELWNCLEMELIQGEQYE